MYINQGGRWDASRGTLQDKNAKKSSRKEGVRKRERAMAYAFSQQVLGHFIRAVIFPTLVWKQEHNHSGWEFEIGIWVPPSRVSFGILAWS